MHDENGSLRADFAGYNTRQQRHPHLPNVMRQAILDKVLVFVLVLPDVYQVIVSTWPVTNGMKVQDHSNARVTARQPVYLV